MLNKVYNFSTHVKTSNVKVIIQTAQITAHCQCLQFLRHFKLHYVECFSKENPTSDLD